MTVREALDQKREQLQGWVAQLVLCKRELFYVLKEGKMGNSPDDSVYPVGHETAAKEAAFYGVPWSEQ